MRKNTAYIFSTKIEVRDYECDIQGIVNNARYLHYAEHTRHRFLTEAGISFAELHRRGIDSVVARMTLEYKAPLECDDVVVSKMGLRKEGLKYIFTHDFFRERDGRLAFHAEVTLVVLIDGRLGASKEYDEAFARYLAQNDAP